MHVKLLSIFYDVVICEYMFMCLAICLVVLNAFIVIYIFIYPVHILKLKYVLRIKVNILYHIYKYFF